MKNWGIRSLTLAAAVFVAAPASAERRFFPVTGDATVGGSYGHYGQFNGHLFVGYSHGVQFHKDSLSGVTFAIGPQYTYRSFDRQSIGCRALEKDKEGKAIEKDDGCADGHSIGVLLRVGLAFLVDEDHHAPDHMLYVGVQPFTGSEPQLSFKDGYVHDLGMRGVRFTAGYNFFVWSRVVVESITGNTRGRDDAMLILALPAALFNKFEIHYEIVRVPDGRSENRWGFATGFGF